MQPFPAALIATSVPFMASMGFTPGPNNIMVASSGVNFGFRATLPHILGVTVGYPLMLLLVGLGLAKVFTLLPSIHTILKFVCIIYLVYLAWRIATAGAVGEGRRTARPLGFWQAAAFQWVNAKGWVAALSVVTTYTLMDSPLIPQVLALALLSLLVTIGAMLTWALGGTILRRYLHTEAHRRLFNYSMAALLLLSIVPVLFE